MRAAADFAAAYGFPPSQCSPSELIGLLANVERVLATRDMHTAVAIASVMSADVLADLMDRAGLPRKDVLKARMADLRNESVIRKAGR